MIKTNLSLFDPVLIGYPEIDTKDPIDLTEEVGKALYSELSKFFTDLDNKEGEFRYNVQPLGYSRNSVRVMYVDFELNCKDLIIKDIYNSFVVITNTQKMHYYDYKIDIGDQNKIYFKFMDPFGYNIYQWISDLINKALKDFSNMVVEMKSRAESTEEDEDEK